MKPPPDVFPVVRFGSFVFDHATGELTRQGRRVALQDQPARVLGLLLARAGSLVTRDELRQALWPEDTFVEFETGIAVAINKIRRALGDSATSPRFVETVPKHGYRFLADVHVVSAAVPHSLPPIAKLEGRPRLRLSLASMLGVVTLMVLVSIAGGALSRRPAFDGLGKPLSLTVMPFHADTAGLRDNIGVEVDAVLEGTLRASADRVDVSIRLVRTRDKSAWWQESFDARDQFVSPYEIGRMYVSLDDRDEAFGWFTKACDIKDPKLSTIRAAVRSDSLRSDPRFQTVLECVGLPPLPAASQITDGSVGQTTRD